MLSFPTPPPSVFLYMPLVLVTLVFAKIYFASRESGLSQFPGPWFARYTDLWRAYQAYSSMNKSNYDYEALRQNYGDVVRIGPSIVLVFDPEAVPTIFGTGSRLDKGDGYNAFHEPGGKPGPLLTIIDEDTHSRYKRAHAHAYSLSALKDYEPNVNLNILKMAEILAQCAEKAEVVNISRLGHFFAYDTVALLTFGRCLGFLDTGKDQSGLVAVQKQVTSYAMVMWHLTWLDRFLKSALPSALLQVGIKPFKDFMSSTIQQRLADRSAGPKAPKPDLVAHFIQSQKKYPAEMDDYAITVSASGSLLAGSQSPSMVLHVIFQYLAASPDMQHRLFSEVGDIVSKSAALPKFDDVQALPYLNGVIREGYRLHTFGFSFAERMTAAAGLELPNGAKLPGNIKVAMAFSGFTKRKDIYGDDADEFNPERWLQRKDESDADYAKRHLMMARSDLSFGYGSRICIGKNLTNLEMYKLISTLAAKFEFEAVGTPTVGTVDVRVRRR